MSFLRIVGLIKLSHCEKKGYLTKVMSSYYWFSEKQEYVKHNKAMEHKRYMYDPVTDSYVENISVLEKERYLHNKDGRYGFDDFYHVLNEMISEK